MLLRILTFSWLLGITMGTAAQYHLQTDTPSNQYIRIIPIDKARLLKNIDVIFNMQYANDSHFQNGAYSGSSFAMNQFRLEIKGQVSQKVYFRFRERYTRESTPQSIDNIDHSVDMAFIQIDLSPKWSIAFGKMSADYGGYQFAANPINIYQYNDVIAYSDPFLAGIQAAWNISKDHALTVQVLNSRTATFAQLYDTIPRIQPARFPVAAVVNWRGWFANRKIRTFWSYAVLTEAAHKYVYYVALGNQFRSGKWLVQYDLQYNPEGIDRTTIVSAIVPKNYSPYTALNTFYLEHWLHMEYGFASRWKAAITAMTSAAYWYGNPDQKKNDHLRTAYGLIPSLEFYPFKELNLKFFAAYAGRFYNYTQYSRFKFGSSNSTTGDVMIGFITPLNVL